jgi:hypothetical protein
MKSVEFRVRPVTRFVLTRYSSHNDGHSCGGSLETLGEFDNEAYAREVMRVMELEAYWAERRGDGPTGSGQETG